MRPLTLTGNPSRSPRTPTRVPNNPAPASIAARPTNSAHVAHASDPVSAGPSPRCRDGAGVADATELLAVDVGAADAVAAETVGSCAAVTAAIVRPGDHRCPGLWTRPAFWNTDRPGGLRCRACSPSNVRSRSSAASPAVRPACPRWQSGRTCPRAPCRACSRRSTSSVPSISSVPAVTTASVTCVVELAAAAQPGRSLVAIARPHLVQLREALGRGHRALGARRSRRPLPRPRRGRPSGPGARLDGRAAAGPPRVVRVRVARRRTSRRARRVPRRPAATGDRQDDDRSRVDPPARRRRPAAGERSGSTRSSSRASTRSPRRFATWATGWWRPSTPTARRSASRPWSRRIDHRAGRRRRGSDQCSPRRTRRAPRTMTRP